MSNKILILVLGVLTMCSSCSSTRNPKNDSAENEEITNIEALPEIVVNAQPKNIRKFASTKYWELLHTQLDILPHISENTVEASALLWLSPHAFQNIDSIVLDAKYLNIQDLAICENSIKYSFQNEQKLLSLQNYTKTPYRLKLHLPKKYASKDTLCLYIKYTVTPDSVPDGGGSQAIRERKGIYLLHPDSLHPTRPRQLWTQGEPESASFWFPTLDAPNQKSTQVLRVHYPSDMMSLSNGLRVSSTSIENIQTDTWVNTLKISPYLFSLVVGNFAVDSTSYYNDIQLSYLVDPQYAEYARSIYDHTPEMIAYFEDLTGVKFPWQKYSQVLVHDFVSGAMENTSAVTFGHFIQKNNRELLDESNDAIVAHELFHHWFGNLVTFESWNHISLSESFATLGSLLWQGHKGGPEVEAYQRHKMFELYLKTAKDDEPPLLRNFYQKPGDVFDRISYQKGATILYMLRKQIGEKVFSAAMKKYLESHAFQSAELEDWRQSLEEVTGKDMSLFFDQWYYSSGVAKLSMTLEDDDELGRRRLSITYREPSKVYDLQPQLRILGGGVDSIATLTLQDTVQYWDFEYIDGQAPLLILDPGHYLAADITYHCPDSYWKKILSSITHYDDVHAAIQNLTNIDSRDVQISLARLAARNIPGTSLLAATKLVASSISDPIFSSKILNIVKDSTNDSKLRAELLKKLAHTPLPDTKKWLQAYTKDKSYTVCAAALQELDSIDHSYALQYALDSVNNVYGDLYETCLDILANQGTDIYVSKILEEVDGNYGKDCYLPAYYLSKSLTTTKEDSIFEKSVNTLIQKAATDDLQALDEYILKHLYNNFIKLSKQEKYERASYIRKSIEQDLYPVWDRPQRIEELKEVYNWQVKF